MIDDFEQEFGGDEESPPTDSAERVARELTEETIDDEIAEAEKRLVKASYYRAIVRDGVMEDDGTEGSREINAEARLWARQQMAKLIGLTPAAAATAPQPAPNPFSEKEVLVLKKLVERTLALQGEKLPEPTVRKVQAPVAPAVRKVESTTPKPKPKHRPPVAQAPASEKQVIRRPKLVNGEVDYDSIPTGEVFRDPKDKQLYKFVPHPTKDNTRSKIKVTGQVKNPAKIPMPSVDQMPGITHAQSTQAMDTGASHFVESLREGKE